MRSSPVPDWREPCGSRALRRACGRDSAVASENAPSTLSRRPPPAATADLPRECADTIKCRVCGIKTGESRAVSLDSRDAADAVQPRELARAHPPALDIDGGSKPCMHDGGG